MHRLIAYVSSAYNKSLVFILLANFHPLATNNSKLGTLNSKLRTPNLSVCVFDATTWSDFWLMANEERLSASPRTGRLRRRAMRKPLSFPHLPFALYLTYQEHAKRSINILAANGFWREDEDLRRARRNATSPGRGVKPPARDHLPKSFQVVCA